MKKRSRSPLRHGPCALALLLCGTLFCGAEAVYVTSNTSNCTSSAVCGQTPNFDANPNTGDYVYNDNGLGAFTSAISKAEGKPATPGARYFSNSFSNSTPDLAIKLNPALAVPGGIYQVYHVFTSSAGNVSSNITVAVTNTAGCALSFTNTDKFQSKYGVAVGGANAWQLLGYLTNDPGSANPAITLYYESGMVNAGAQQRLIVDTFRFVKYEPCLDVPVVRPTGPLAINIATVPVTGVNSNATKVTVYQDVGSGMVALASTNLSSPTGTIYVVVSGLVQGAQVAATQTINNQEGCVPTTGFFVGGGANPSLRFAFSIRANPNLVGPVGSTSGGTNANIFFLGASNVLSGTAPDCGVVLFPSTNWQTISLTRGDPVAPVDPWVLWNGTGDFLGDYGGLDGVAIASEGDPGPILLYLDDLSNGTNGVVQNWESPDVGTANYQFNTPGLSGTTAGNLLGAPSSSVVTSEAAFGGAKSLRVDFEFNGLETNRWLRLVTASAGGVQNPQLDLNEPISIKVLLLPPGASIGSPAPGPLTLTRDRDQIRITWSGVFQLQNSPSVLGPFIDVPGATNSPYSTSIGENSTFFRLRK